HTPFFAHYTAAHRALHSFPTRRSSDLHPIGQRCTTVCTSIGKCHHFIFNTRNHQLLIQQHHLLWLIVHVAAVSHWVPELVQRLIQRVLAIVLLCLRT